MWAGGNMSMAKKWKQKQKQQKEKAKAYNREKFRKYYQKNRDKEILRKQKYYYKKRGELVETLGGRCKFCGQFDNGFNIHHKVPMVVFENKIAHYFRHIDIMLLLCPDCHMTWHEVMDWLGIDDIFKDN